MLETLYKTSHDSKIYHYPICIKNISNLIKAKSTITFLNKVSFSSLSTNLSHDELNNFIKFDKMNIQRKSFSETNEDREINFFDLNKYNDTIELNDEEKLKYQGEIIFNILNQRKKNAIKISSFLKRKFNRIHFKKNFLLNQILHKRFFLISKIQANIKGYLVKKSIQKIFNYEYVFFFFL